MITVHKLNEFKFGNAAFQLANMLGYATLHGFEFGLTEPWKFQHLFKHPLPILKSKPSKILTETQFNYYELPVQDNIALSGYWQSPQRFMHCMDLVKHYLTLSDEVVAAAEAEHKLVENVVCHVRLTDYTGLADYHTNIHKTDYYGKALLQIALHKPTSFAKPTKVFVCSDDVGWCKENSWINAGILNEELATLMDYRLTFSGTEEPIHDFYYMTQAENLIITNSSFSALAALLNKNSHNVIAPKQWFAEKGPAEWSSVYHPDWTVI